MRATCIVSAFGANEYTQRILHTPHKQQMQSYHVSRSRSNGERRAYRGSTSANTAHIILYSVRVSIFIFSFSSPQNANPNWKHSRVSQPLLLVVAIVGCRLLQITLIALIYQKALQRIIRTPCTPQCTVEWIYRLNRACCCCCCECVTFPANGGDFTMIADASAAVWFICYVSRSASQTPNASSCASGASPAVIKCQFGCSSHGACVQQCSGAALANVWGQHRWRCRWPPVHQQSEATHRHAAKPQSLCLIWPVDLLALLTWHVGGSFYFLFVRCTGGNHKAPPLCDDCNGIFANRSVLQARPTCLCVCRIEFGIQASCFICLVTWCFNDTLVVSNHSLVMLHQNWNQSMLPTHAERKQYEHMIWKKNMKTRLDELRMILCSYAPNKLSLPLSLI